jgi:hypothetical protein
LSALACPSSVWQEAVEVDSRDIQSNSLLPLRGIMTREGASAQSDSLTHAAARTCRVEFVGSHRGSQSLIRMLHHSQTKRYAVQHKMGTESDERIRSDDPYAVSLAAGKTTVNAIAWPTVRRVASSIKPIVLPIQYCDKSSLFFDIHFFM